MNLIEKFHQKTKGLSNREIALEAFHLFKSRLLRRYSYAKASLLGTEISDDALMRSLVIKNRDLHKYFCLRTEPRAFAGLQTVARTCELTVEYFPVALDEIVSEAEEILNHKFSFLGRRHQYATEEIDWFWDSSIDYKWPSEHFTQISTAGTKPGADIKIPWELARLQHFVTLGQAYRLTGDERYSKEFRAQMISFAQKNPPEMGIHWLSAMEVALRAVSLSTAFYLFRESKSFDEEALKTLLKLLLSHAQFIEGHLEFSHRITSNHYLSDLVGLLFVGLLFPEFKRSVQWAEFARTELFKEMDKQIYDDGADWESSIGYHALVLELYLYSFLLMKEQGIDIEARYWKKLEKMFEFVRAYIKPDGAAPIIGDCDDGRAVVWKRRAAFDHSYLLSIAALLFENERFKLTERLSEEALWIFGEQGWDIFEGLPASEEKPSSAAFNDAGVYIQREGNLYAIIDCGDVGINGRGSHAHNDLLSFEICARGRSFLVDAGSYVYTGDPQARNLFRSTAFHNTVMTDGKEINEIYPNALFIIGNQAKPKVNLWESNAQYDLLDAEHDGYMRLPQGIVHRRRIRLNKIEGCWLITDSLIGEGEHLFEFFFNFDSGLCVQTVDSFCAVATDEDSGVSIAVAPTAPDGMKVELVDRYVSKGYNRREQSQGAVYRLKTRAPVEVQFLIVPGNEGDLSSMYEAMEICKNNREGHEAHEGFYNFSS